jgi:hypothetical protein
MILIIEKRQVTSLRDDFVCYIGDRFMFYNHSLQSINLSRVRTIGTSFMFDNESLQSINLPRVRTIGAWFMYSNKNIKKSQFIK